MIKPDIIKGREYIIGTFKTQVDNIFMMQPAQGYHLEVLSLYHTFLILVIICNIAAFKYFFFLTYQAIKNSKMKFNISFFRIRYNGAENKSVDCGIPRKQNNSN